MKIKNVFYLSLTLILTLLLGCEKEFDNVIENSNTDYQVTSVSPSDSIRYNLTDSLITIRISFSLFTNIQSVYCDVYDVDNLKLSSSPLSLLDNGNIENGDDTLNDGIFANKFPLSTYYPNGIYSIKYFVTDNSNITKQVALGTFNYHNGQPSVAPVISNAVLIDSINPNVSFVFFVDAKDANGYRDIKRVYFQLYRPDSTIVVDQFGQSKFNMNDNGEFEHFGDLLPGDGTFSYKNSFSPTAQKGIWRFEFEAEDRDGMLSNKIIKSIKVL